MAWPGRRARERERACCELPEDIARSPRKSFNYWKTLQLVAVFADSDGISCCPERLSLPCYFNYDFDDAPPLKPLFLQFHDRRRLTQDYPLFIRPRLSLVFSLLARFFPFISDELQLVGPYVIWFRLVGPLLGFFSLTIPHLAEEDRLTAVFSESQGLPNPWASP